MNHNLKFKISISPIRVDELKRDSLVNKIV